MPAGALADGPSPEQETGLLAAQGGSCDPPRRRLPPTLPAAARRCGAGVTACGAEPQPVQPRGGAGALGVRGAGSERALRHAGIAVPMVTAARVWLKSQEKDEQASAAADNDKEKNWEPSHRKYKKRFSQVSAPSVVWEHPGQGCAQDAHW